MNSMRRVSWKSLAMAAAVAGLVLSPAGCKKKPTVESSTADANAHMSALSNAPSTPAQFHVANGNGVSIAGGNSYANVTYKETVKALSHDEVASSLQGISSDGHGWLFKNADANIKNLKADDVFMVKGEMAGKVLGVVTQGDQTLVELGQASLKDVVAGGKIDAPVRFHGTGKSTKLEEKPFFDRISNLIEEPVYAQSVETIIPNAARAAGTQDAAGQVASGIASAVTSGWTVTAYSFTPGDSVCNFFISMSKDVGGFVARVAVHGTISDFDFASNLDWTQIQATGGAYIGPAMANSLKNMKGTMQFNWEIGKQTPGVWATEDRVKLPGGISVPLAPVLAGMPLTLDISSALLIHPALTGGNEFSSGGFVLTFGSGEAGGFSTASTGAVTDGGANINLTFGITDDVNLSPVAPNAMVISYCAPRIELRLDILGPFASSLSSAGSWIDRAVSGLKMLLPASAQAALANSPLSQVTASNILASNADVFFQFIATEGVTHSSNVTLAPCTKQEIKFDGDAGIGAQFFGLTSSAVKTTNIFTKTFTHWVPDSNFCKGV